MRECLYVLITSVSLTLKTVVGKHIRDEATSLLGDRIVNVTSKRMQQTGHIYDMSS